MEEKQKKEVLYEVVSKDRYELPLFVGTAGEVAAFTGTQRNNVYVNWCRYGERSKYRRVIVDKD